MAANAINNYFHGANSPGFGLGSLGSLGLASSPKPPQLERYHEEHGWTKSKPKKKGNVALSALTLLAFLFFLHILQSCIQEHMYEMKGKGDDYKHPITMGNTQLPTIIIVDNSDSSSNSMDGRDNLKGDDGVMASGMSAELNKWPLQANTQQKEAQNRFFAKSHVSRPKKKTNRQQDQGNGQTQDGDDVNKSAKNNGNKQHGGTHNTRLHRTDDLPLPLDKP